MLWTNGKTDSPGVAVLDDPSVGPLVVLEAETADDDSADESEVRRLPCPWPALTEASPALILGARDPEEDEDEDEDEEDADFFDDEEDEDDDLDDDLEDEDLDEEDEEDEEEEEEEEEDDDF